MRLLSRFAPSKKLGMIAGVHINSKSGVVGPDVKSFTGFKLVSITLPNRG